MYRETAYGFRAFFPGAAVEAEPEVLEPVETVELPAPKYEMLMAMARAAYGEGYRMTPAGLAKEM